MERQYPGDLRIEPGLDSDLGSGSDPKIDSTHSGDTAPPIADADPTRTDEPSSRRSLREIWSQPEFRVVPGDGSVSGPTTEIPIDPVRTLDTTIDSVIDDPGRVGIDSLDAR